MVNRGSTAGFVPPPVYIGIPLFVLAQGCAEACPGTFRVIHPDTHWAGRSGAGRGGVGRGWAELASLRSTRQTRRLHSWHLCLQKPKQFNECSFHLFASKNKKKLLCKLAEEQKPRLPYGLLLSNQRFISKRTSVHCSWMPDGKSTSFFCKPFS